MGQPEFSGMIIGFFLSNTFFLMIVETRHLNSAIEPWWLALGAAILGAVFLAEMNMKAFAGHFVFRPRNWVRIVSCHRAYLKNVTRSQLKNWCLQNAKGRWLISQDNQTGHFVCAFSQKSDLAMFVLEFEKTTVL